MLAVVSGVAPQNEVEGVLAVQIAASHHLAMTLLARVGRAEHIPVLESNGNMALKLLRISREHAEALAKLRRGGSQTVRVEHVHVHSGGQAIVGNVAHPGARGTGNKTDNQPHAPGAENGKT
jgi:Trk K+ transport system NAD-binding subunit